MSRVPRIRFKGFEEDWEQRKLGEVANRFDSTRIPISENLRVLGNTPYYGANGIQDYVDGYTHDGEYVLIAEDGANDLKNYPIRLVKGRIWVNNHAHVIQGIEKIMNNQFINFAMSQVDFESIVVGCGRAKLNAEQLMDICFKIPNKKEQANIGRLFESLDHLITLHQLEPFQLIFKAIAYRIIDYFKSKPPRSRKYTNLIQLKNTIYENCVYSQYNYAYSLKIYYIKNIIILMQSAYICIIII